MLSGSRRVLDFLKYCAELRIALCRPTESLRIANDKEGSDYGLLSASRRVRDGKVSYSGGFDGGGRNLFGDRGHNREDKEAAGLIVVSWDRPFRLGSIQRAVHNDKCNDRLGTDLHDGSNGDEIVIGRRDVGFGHES
jgi:hypothetical protein